MAERGNTFANPAFSGASLSSAPVLRPVKISDWALRGGRNRISSSRESNITAPGSRQPERYRKLGSWKKEVCRSSGSSAPNSTITPSRDLRRSVRRCLYSEGEIPPAKRGRMPTRKISARRMMQVYRRAYRDAGGQAPDRGSAFTLRRHVQEGGQPNFPNTPSFDRDHRCRSFTKGRLCKAPVLGGPTAGWPILWELSATPLPRCEF